MSNMLVYLHKAHPAQPGIAPSQVVLKFRHVMIDRTEDFDGLMVGYDEDGNVAQITVWSQPTDGVTLLRGGNAETGAPSQEIGTVQWTSLT